MKRWNVFLTGLIQGVGFRPFVYRQAKKLSLKGWVRNSGDGVNIAVEGEQEKLNSFVESIEDGKPPGSYIIDIEIEEGEVENFSDFKIVESTIDRNIKTPLIPPDVAVCGDCLREIRDKSDRRHDYPFISCTYCGPRFTIIKSLPYDRPATTMAPFYLCKRCYREYNDPDDRRFHAQTTGCPDCGPRVALVMKDRFHLNEEALDKTCEMLERGAIVALKGIGGYCLACDGVNEPAVKKIKDWKSRGDKPMAIMVRDVETAKKLVKVSEFEEDVLTSPSRPILLAEKVDSNLLSDEVAPHLDSLGIMLPNSPLHHKLMEGNYTSLIMTSANRRNEPIICDDTDAFRLIGEVADGVLTTERTIHTRADDSVGMAIKGDFTPTRLGRGYAPVTVPVPEEIPPTLAFGSDLKNTFCLICDGLAYLSQHIGDLENTEVFRFYISEMERFKNILGINPEVYVSDMSPSYYSSRYADEMFPENIKVQHHHAHMVSVLAELNSLEGRYIGIGADGTGYGLDGEVWGFEVFDFTVEDFKRIGHLKYKSLPGGEETVRKPYRMAISYILSIFGESADEIIQNLYPDVVEEELSVIKTLIKDDDRRLSPLTSSMGRLFDAVGSILGICQKNSYDAQASMMLEARAWGEKISDTNVYRYEIGDGGIISVDETIEYIIRDRFDGESVGKISAKFHKTMGDLICNLVYKYYNEGFHKGIVLSGGVFQNRVLTRYLIERFKGEKIPYFIHSMVPPNDAGISLGQAVIGGYKSLRC